MASNAPTMVQLIAQATSIVTRIVEAGGELTDELEKELDLTEKLIIEKVDAYYYVIERLKAEELFFKKRGDEMSRIGRACDKTVKFMQAAVKEAMTRMDMKQIIGVERRFVLSKAKSKVEVTDESSVPAIYFREVVEMKLDLEAVRAALEAGKDVPGAKLIPNTSLRNYPVNPVSLPKESKSNGTKPKYKSRKGKSAEADSNGPAKDASAGDRADAGSVEANSSVGGSKPGTA